MGENQVNRGKNLAQIESDEESRLDELSTKKDVTVFKLAHPEEPQGFKRGVDPELVQVNNTITVLRGPGALLRAPSGCRITSIPQTKRLTGLSNWSDLWTRTAGCISIARKARTGATF